MPTVLICADSIRSPEMRHEVPVPVPDPMLYVEHEDTRFVIASAFELQRIRGAERRRLLHRERGQVVIALDCARPAWMAQPGGVNPAVAELETRQFVVELELDPEGP